MSKAFTLDSTFVNLRPDDSATTLKIGPRFWATIEKRTDLGDGRLMGVMPQKADWPHWERHPGGDEILVMLSGEMDLVVETRSATAGGGSRPGRPSSCRVASGTAAWRASLASSCSSRPAPAPNTVR